MTEINTRRVYADPDGDAATDGYRIYVDRLWPRGESKSEFHYDFWAKDTAPSRSLREWFHYDMDSRWPEFERRCRAEFEHNPKTGVLVEKVRRQGHVTLLFSSKDEAHNNATVLVEYIRDILNRD